MRVNSKLAAKSKGFAQTFNNRREEEIAGQLDRVGSLSFLADQKDLLPDRVEKRSAAFDLIGWAGRNNEQLRGGCGVRPAEDRRGQIVLLFFAMTFRQPSRQSDADRAHGNMNSTGRKDLYGISR